MSFQATLTALCAFAFVSSVTPGPNNLMLLASGVNFGFRRTVPHLMGVTLGFVFMVLLLGLGLGQVFARAPMLYATLKWVGAAYMLWLAWKIATAAPLSGETDEAAGKPMTFLQAAAFQWVNPKAWIMGVTTVATYSLLSDPGWNALAVATVFGVTNLPSVGIWVMFGVSLRRILSDPARLRAFNWSMAALLIVSLLPLFQDILP